MNLRLRPRPVLVFVYLGLLLTIELIGEVVMANQSAYVRAMLNWTVLLLATMPPMGWLAWRTGREDQHFSGKRQAEWLRQMIAALTSEPDASRVPGLLTEQLRELTDANLAFLARPEGSEYQVTVVAGDDSHRLVGQRLPISAASTALAGQALRGGRPALLADTWSDDGLAARRELALSDRVRSVGVVPLIIRGEVIGVVVLHASTAGKLNTNLTDLLEAYTEHAIAPLENALLLDSVRQMDTAQQIDRQKSEFLSAVAHELHGPLTPMLGWAEMLLGRPYSHEQARPMIQNLYESAQHLSVLVGDLMDLARGEAGRLSLELVEVDLGELLESAASRWKELEPDHHFILAAAGPIPMRADVHRMRQVLDNLLSNAAKYSPADSRIFITARLESRGRAIVRITDQGIGLAPEEQAQLFAKFYRTETARQLAGGSGLGLALCRLIVEAHGGDMRVESDGLGFGSAFSFGLPVSGPKQAQDRTAHAALAAARAA